MSGIADTKESLYTFARNVAKLTLDNVKIEGQVGEAYELEGVDELIRR